MCPDSIRDLHSFILYRDFYFPFYLWVAQFFFFHLIIFCDGCTRIRTHGNRKAFWLGVRRIAVDLWSMRITTHGLFAHFINLQINLTFFVSRVKDLILPILFFKQLITQQSCSHERRMLIGQQQWLAVEQKNSKSLPHHSDHIYGSILASP